MSQKRRVTTRPVLEHDFTKSFAKRRTRIYAWGSAFTATVAVAGIIGVGLGWLPMVKETGIIACTLFMTPVFIMFIAAWFDAPGEKRTTLEKSNEFSMLWSVSPERPANCVGR